MAFDETWEKEIYSKNKQKNNYPFDWVVSNVHKFIKKKNLVIEYGCGSGNNLGFLYNFGFKTVIGIDGSNTAIKFCKNKYLKIKNIECNVADFTNFTNKKKADLILDRASITHNTKPNIKKIISNIYQNLNNGGVFMSYMFSTKHHAKMDKKKNLYFKKTMNLKNGLQSSFFSENEIKKIFKKFKLISLNEIIDHDKLKNLNIGIWSIICKK